MCLKASGGCSAGGGKGAGESKVQPITEAGLNANQLDTQIDASTLWSEPLSYKATESLAAWTLKALSKI